MVPNKNAVGDPYYYSGVDHVTPNLIRPINTRDTWTQATVNEYDPLHNYGIRRLVAEGKGCVGYRYSCCYQSMGSEGCIIGYPERERGSIPQLYTWFGGFPPSEITKQYRGLVFQGNEVKCKHLHAKIMERITTTMLGKIVAGNFDGLTDNERKSVYRIAELMHEYNENIAPGSPPNLPKSTAQKDITEYLRRVVRLEKTTTEVAKEKEFENIMKYLTKHSIEDILNQQYLLPSFPFDRPFTDDRGFSRDDYVSFIKNIIETTKTFDRTAIDEFNEYSEILLYQIFEKDFQDVWNKINMDLRVRRDLAQNVYIELLKEESFRYSEYVNVVRQRIPSEAPAREYLLELGRFRVDVPFDQLALEADKSKNLDKIENKDVETLRKKRKGIEFKELQRVTNDFLSAITSWQLGGDKQLKENVMTMFEQMFQHIELSNNEEWIKFIRKNRSHVLRWISSVASAPSIAKAKTFLSTLATVTLQFAQGISSQITVETLQKELDTKIETLDLDIKQGTRFDNELGLELIKLKNNVPNADPTGTNFYTVLNRFRLETVGKDKAKEEVLQKFADYIVYYRPKTQLAVNITLPQEYATRYEFVKVSANEVIKTMDQLKSFNQKKIAENRSARDIAVESAENRAMYYPADSDVWVDVYKLQMGGYVDALRDFFDSEKTPSDIETLFDQIKRDTEIKLGTIK